MRNLLFILVFFVSAAAQSQDWTWEQRLENCHYYAKTLNDDQAFTTGVMKASGDFSFDEMAMIEELCLRNDQQGVFKLEVITSKQLKIYHLSGVNEFSIQMLFEEAFGAPNMVVVGNSTPYEFE